MGMTNTEKTSVLITGGNKGLGLEAARRLGVEGWKVFLGSRDERRGRAAVDELAGAGLDVVMVPLDVTSDGSVSDAVQLVRRHTDRLDVLINNAGASGNVVPPAEATAEEVHSVYDTNVYGPIRVTHAFLPLLQAADAPRVVMVSSAGGSFAVITDPEQPVSKMHELAYSSSKAALNMVTVKLGVHLREDGVIAVALHPGVLRTALASTRAPDLEEVAPAAAEIVALIDGLTMADTGTFRRRDGSVHPW